MLHTPEIAIIEPNTLTSIGLRIILEELIPNAVIRSFSTFEALIDDTPDMYAHYFVSAQIYFAHTSFFLNRRPRAIVLAVGEQPALNGVPTLNICLPQDQLVQAIMQLRKYGHSMHPHPSTQQQDIEHELNISLTTVISHRKNITEKLGIKSVSGLAIYAVMRGYIEADSI